MTPDRYMTVSAVARSPAFSFALNTLTLKYSPTKALHTCLSVKTWNRRCDDDVSKNPHAYIVRNAISRSTCRASKSPKKWQWSRAGACDADNGNAGLLSNLYKSVGRYYSGRRRRR